MNNYTALKSGLAKARNLGSASEGSHHWIMQRLSAVLMIPLFVWLAYFLINLMGAHRQDIMHFIKLPYNIIPLSLLLVTGLYHGMLGMQIVIEDYVSTLCTRNFLIITMKFFTFVTIFSAAVALVFFLGHI